ncbi:hypothetical protein AX14_000911 [Amanita brunnescens Koide BX004]|nr:hypothetical protein AX14_000911 [Amanita brunnescens Koide BX004]
MSPPGQISATSIFARVLPEWQIEEITHIPIHMTRCNQCANFATHVANQTQGGTLEILNEKQRHHWKHILEMDFRQDCEDAFRKGTQENEKEIEELKDEIQWLKDKHERHYHQADAVKDENEGCQYSSYSQGGARMEPAGNTRQLSKQRSPQHCTPVAKSPPSRSCLIDRIGLPKPPRQPVPAEPQHDTQPQPTEEVKAAQARETDATTLETQPVAQMDMPIDPAPHSPSIMSDTSSNVRMKGTGRKLPNMYGTDEDFSSDETNVSVMPSDAEEGTPGRPIGSVSKPMPYRLNRIGFNHLRAEPDIKRMVINKEFPNSIQHSEDGHLNIKDITAWLLFKMAEPEEEAVIKWSWWEACQMFSRWGMFSEMLWDMKLKEGSQLVPVRLLINGEPTWRDIVKHFIYCGTRISNANTHLKDYASIYVEANSPPPKPDWASIPLSRPYESRPPIYQCCLCHNPCFRVNFFCFMRISCFVACGDSHDHPWKSLMLRAWDGLH